MCLVDPVYMFILNICVCRVEDGGLFSDKKSEGEEEEEKGKAKTKVSFIVEMTCIV